jgi:hypothetical protein
MEETDFAVTDSGSSDSDVSDPYRDDPVWTASCANACDVKGNTCKFLLFCLVLVYGDVRRY